MARREIQTTTDSEELLSDIKRQQEVVDKKRGLWEVSKETTKELKEDFEAARDHLEAIIRDNDDRPLLNTED